MPIMVIYSDAAISKQSYEDVKRAIGWEAAPPAGAMLHLAGFDTQDHLFEINLWESEASFRAYADETLKPAALRAGVDLPEPHLVPLHNAAAVAMVDAYVPRLTPSAA